MKKIAAFMLLFICIETQAQNVSDQLTQSFDNPIKVEQSEIDDELPPEFERLIEHPIDINSDEINLLLQLNLVSQIQLNAIKDHIKRFGKLISLEELQVINEFDLQTIKSILPYVKITESNVSEAESHNFTFRFQQQVKDYIPADYQGDPTKLTLKYRGNFNGNINCSFLAEKDPGEKVIFGSGKAGFDFYSFFVQVKLKGVIKRMIIGDYSVSFGQGLTAWSGSGYSSNENIISICKSGRGIYPSSSTDENRFLRGIAMEGKIKKLQFQLWLSSHKIDGNIEKDSTTGDEYIRSFQTSGYHRSQSESNGYHACRETYMGIALKRNFNGWNSEITTSFYKLNLPLQKTYQEYNQFDFRGLLNVTIGVDYSKTIKNILLFGEIATCSNRATAFINGIFISMNKNLSLSAVYHNYQKDFHSLKSNPFGSNTNPANESGIYLGLNLKFNKATSLTTYVNHDQFPFLKFRADLPTENLTRGVLFTFIPSKKLNFTIRYRNKISLLNNSDDYEGLRILEELNLQNLRFSISLISDDTWEYRSKVEIGIKKINSINFSDGYFYCQDIFFHPPKKKISANIRYALYYSPDFDLRFYEYENDLPGAFSIPFYYGNGSKMYLNLSYKFRNVVISAKYARTWTTYSDNILNSTSAIDDVKLQVRFNW